MVCRAPSGVVARVDLAGMAPAFFGRTSLWKGWELIERSSEDTAFKLARRQDARSIPAGTGSSNPSPSSGESSANLAHGELVKIYA